MNDRDLLILAVYVISVVYVCYTAFSSLSEWAIFKFDDEGLKAQLEEQGLKGLLNIQFKFAKQYKLDGPQELSINIENQSEVSLIYANWDNSSLTDLSGRARRVVRKTPDLSPELSQAQNPSTISPGQRLQEKLVPEDSLRQDKDTQNLKVVAPLVRISQLGQKKGQQQQYANFIAGEEPLTFLLKLVLQVFDPSVGSGTNRFHVLTCNFSVHKQPWTANFKR